MTSILFWDLIKQYVITIIRIKSKKYWIIFYGNWRKINLREQFSTEFLIKKLSLLPHLSKNFKENKEHFSSWQLANFQMKLHCRHQQLFSYRRNRWSCCWYYPWKVFGLTEKLLHRNRVEINVRERFYNEAKSFCKIFSPTWITLALFSCYLQVNSTLILSTNISYSESRYEC